MRVFIWEHLKAYTVNKPIVSCLAWLLYRYVLGEWLLQSNLAVNSRISAMLSKNICGHAVSRETQSCPLQKNCISKFTFSLFLSLLRIQTLSNVVCFLSHDHYRARKVNGQNLKLDLLPKSKLAHLTFLSQGSRDH